MFWQINQNRVHNQGKKRGKVIFFLYAGTTIIRKLHKFATPCNNFPKNCVIFDMHYRIIYMYTFFGKSIKTAGTQLGENAWGKVIPMFQAQGLKGPGHLEIEQQKILFSLLFSELPLEKLKSKKKRNYGHATAVFEHEFTPLHTIMDTCRGRQE